MNKEKDFFSTLPKPWVNSLQAAGIHSPLDIITRFPIRFENWERPIPITDLSNNSTALVEGEIIDSKTIFGGRNKQLLVLLQDNNTHIIHLRFFRTSPSLLRALYNGRHLRARGNVRFTKIGWEMSHPKLQSIHAKKKIVPVYPAIKNMTSDTFHQLVQRILQTIEWIPKTSKTQLPFHGDHWSCEEALRAAHSPSSDNEESTLATNHVGWRRLRFEELLAHHIVLRRRYYNNHYQAPILKNTECWKSDWIASLPFTLTNAQLKVMTEISLDLVKNKPMRRLLQGDVGSGKTIIAAYACLLAVKNGYTAAFMAPTEILAQQHYHHLSSLFEVANVHCELITGGIKGRQRQDAENRINFGISPVVIGTHALFTENISLPRLALTVIDEQHRFGVNQRQALTNKGGDVHQLMMSATPIPRTLAMSVFADMDISVLNEKPAGREPIRTLLIEGQRREEILARAAQHINDGGRVYWICPLIEEAENSTLKDVESLTILANESYPNIKAQAIHGRMKGHEKKAIMDAFRRGEFSLLVATTVVEVGVDVPQADVMIIEHADRLGLSQLHQLRGRVGRGEKKGLCLLLYHSPLSKDATKRLQIMRRHDDGFEIAKQDLLLRGPGEWLGNRQSGLPALRIARLPEDDDLVRSARQTADWMLRYDKRGCIQLLRYWLSTQKHVY